MVDQATMNEAGRATGPSRGRVGRNVGVFLHDVTTLAELQSKLFVFDLQEVKQRAALPLLAVIAGVVIALGTVPVFIFAVSLVLVDSFALSPAAALAITAGTALLLGGVLTWWGLRGLPASFQSLQRSRDELAKNLSWLKRISKQHG